MSFADVLRKVLTGSKVGLRLTSHGARLDGPGAAVTEELRAAAEEHRGRLNALAKAMRHAGKRGGSLAPCFAAWQSEGKPAAGGDWGAGFLTAWFGAFGPELREEDPFELPPASTVTDPARFCDSVHARLRRLQRGELPDLEKRQLRRSLAALYEQFGHRAEALPDPTGTRPPAAYSRAEEPPRGEAGAERQSAARSARAA